MTQTRVSKNHEINPNFDENHCIQNQSKLWQESFHDISPNCDKIPGVQFGTVPWDLFLFLCKFAECQSSKPCFYWEKIPITIYIDQHYIFSSIQTNFFWALAVFLSTICCQYYSLQIQFIS
jgi:hypothetical protein